MATCKSVWFCESDPEKWFVDHKDAERFDQIAEIADYIDENMKEGVEVKIEDVVWKLMERYEIKQRWDWKAPEGEQE